MRAESTRHVSGLAVAMVAGALLCIANPAFAQEPSTTLRGIVTAQGDRAPLVGATVGVPKLGVYVLTNENGEYALPVPAGTHVVRVEAAGHRPREETVVVGAGPAVLDLQVAD